MANTVIPAIPLRTPMFQPMPAGMMLTRTWIMFFEELIGALSGLGGISEKIPQPVHEVPTGLINGVNKVFTLTYSPLNGWLVLHLANALQDPITDYALVGNEITYTTAPQPSDNHHAWYFGTRAATANPSDDTAFSDSVWTARTSTSASANLTIQVWDTPAPIPASYSTVLTKFQACDLLGVMVAFNGSPNFVQAKSAASSVQGNLSVSITFDSPNTAGNLLILDIGFYFTGTDTGVTVSDTLGNTWVAIVQPLASHLGVFICRSCAAGSNTITIAAKTITANAFQFPAVAITEYAPGATPASPDTFAEGLEGSAGASTVPLAVTTTQIVQFLHLAALTGPSGSAHTVALPPASPPH